MFEHFNLAWILKETLPVCPQIFKKCYVIRHLPLHWMQLTLLQVFFLKNAWELCEMKAKIEFTIVSQKIKRMIHFTMGRTHFRVVSPARAGYYSIFTVFLRQTHGSLRFWLFRKGQAQKTDWHSPYLKEHIWSSILENGTLQLLGLLRRK